MENHIGLTVECDGETTNFFVQIKKSKSLVNKGHFHLEISQFRRKESIFFFKKALKKTNREVLIEKN